MVQYPDSIVVTVKVGATQDDDGNRVGGEPTDYTFDCRLEPNGTGRKIPGADGILIDFEFTCYLPITTTVIPVDAKIVATSLNNGEIIGTVKRASNGQLNSRIWL